MVHHVSTTRAASLLALFTGIGTACIESPELRDCIDFPIGTEGCGTGCEIYCEEIVGRCPEVYSDEGACRIDCADEPVTSLNEGAFGDESGNSLACRLTYLRRGECSEASLIDTTACVGASCDAYCDLMLTHCEDAYPSRDNCVRSCEALPRAADDSDQNSVECRFKYATQASSSGDDADCDAASHGGGGVCGEVCDTYCNLVQTNCTDANAIYADRPTCEAVCEALDVEGRYFDWTENADSVQCRIYHAGEPARIGPGTHCPHTSVYNPEQCGGTDGSGDWPCETYCGAVLRNCPGVYADAEECRADCAQFPEIQNVPPEGPELYPVSTLECPTR